MSHLLEVRLELRERRRQLEQRQDEERQAALRAKGVQSQNLALLPTDPGEPMPSGIILDLQKYTEAQKAAQQEARLAAVRFAFQGTWLRDTETELKKCCDRYQATDEPFVRSNTKAYMQVLCQKLKDHHQALGTFNTAEALAERKKLCI